MNKKEILIKKLIKIKKYINIMQVSEIATKIYLKKYKEHLDKLIYNIQNDLMPNSNGALMGLVRGISDYEELCKDDKLGDLALEADMYYSNECKQW